MLQTSVWKMGAQMTSDATPKSAPPRKQQAVDIQTTIFPCPTYYELDHCLSVSDQTALLDKSLSGRNHLEYLLSPLAMMCFCKPVRSDGDLLGLHAIFSSDINLNIPLL
jgi:hypothetical protein